MAKAGRKPKPGDERKRIIDHVLSELSVGRPVSRTLIDGNDLCAQDTFWRWIWEDETGELAEKVSQARANGIEARLDRALMIAESPMMGEIRVDKHINVAGAAVPVTEVRHEDMLGHRKLLIDTEIKAAQMLKPKTYGPKLDLTSGGEKLGLSAEIEAARRRVANGGDNAVEEG